MTIIRMLWKKQNGEDELADEAYRRKRQRRLQSISYRNSDKPHFALLTNPADELPRIRQKLYQWLLADIRHTPSGYFQKEMGWLVGNVLPVKAWNAFLSAADHVLSQSCSRQLGCRGMRIGKYPLYTQAVTDMLFRFVAVFLEDIDIACMIDMPLTAAEERYLKKQYETVNLSEEYGGSTYPPELIAAELDQGNREFVTFLSDILFGKNKNITLNANIVRGIMISRNMDAHSLLCRALVELSPSSDTVQWICRYADCGGEAVFLRILEKVKNEELFCYPAIKRAIAAWIGFDPETMYDVIGHRLVETMSNCLEDGRIRMECLLSENVTDVYLALWSYGFYGMELTEHPIQQIARMGTRCQKLAASYFLYRCAIHPLRQRFALHLLCETDTDDEIAVACLPYLFSHRPVSENSDHSSLPEFTSMLPGRKSAEALFERLYWIYRAMRGQRALSTPEIIFHDRITIQRGQIAELLCGTALFLQEQVYYDQVSILLKNCSSDCRSVYMRIFLSAPRGTIQRHALLDFLCTQDERDFETAVSILQQLELTMADMEYMQKQLPHIPMEHRLKIQSILKNSTEILQYDMVKTFLSCRESRLFALEFVLSCQKEEAFQALAAQCAALVHSVPEDTDEEARLIDLIARQDEMQKNGKLADYEDMLYDASDRYQPVLSAEAYADCFSVFRRYYPASAIIKSHQNAEQTQKECAAHREAVKRIASLSNWLAENRIQAKVEKIRTRSASTTVNRPFDVENNAPFGLAENWLQWYHQECGTPEVLHQTMIAAAAYRCRGIFSEAVKHMIDHVFGNGFSEPVSCDAEKDVLQILIWLCERIVPLQDRRYLAISLGYYFAVFVPQEQLVMALAPKGDPFVTRRRREIVCLAAQSQFLLVLQELRCIPDNTLCKTFPLVTNLWRRIDEGVSASLMRAEDEGKICICPDGGKRATQIRECRSVEKNSLCGVLERPGVLIGVCAVHRGIWSIRAFYEHLFHSELMDIAVCHLTSVAVFLRDDFDSQTILPWIGEDPMEAVRAWMGHAKPFSIEEQADLNLARRIYESVVHIIIMGTIRQNTDQKRYANAISGLWRIYGVNNFVCLLQTLGTQSLRRVYRRFSPAYERRTQLSRLLAVCVPNGKEDVTVLRKALKEKQIRMKSLIQAALYAPAWIPLAESVLQLPGFASACYWIAAHTASNAAYRSFAACSGQARLSFAQLQNGDLDTVWLNDLEKKPGVSVMQELCKAAECIAERAACRRLQTVFGVSYKSIK